MELSERRRFISLRTFSNVTFLSVKPVGCSGNECRKSCRSVELSGSEPIIRVAVDTKYLFSSSGFSLNGLGEGLSIRWITFHTSFGRFEDRVLDKNDLLADLPENIP